MPSNTVSSAEARAIAHIKARAVELGIPPASHDELVEYIMELTRNAWLRGKEIGWKNAWNWKRRGDTTAAGQARSTHAAMDAS